jgi:putative transposase
MEYRYGSHTVFQIEVPFCMGSEVPVQGTQGEVAERVRELVRETCEAFEIRIVKGV